MLSDRIFEKHGIRRDGTGESGKTLDFSGKTRV